MLVAAVEWRPVQRGGAKPVVHCLICAAVELNETNRLRREGWLESSRGERLFVCGECAGQVAP
jgi:hypothetical protein